MPPFDDGKWNENDFHEEKCLNKKQCVTANSCKTIV